MQKKDTTMDAVSTNLPSAYLPKQGKNSEKKRSNSVRALRTRLNVYTIF